MKALVFKGKVVELHKEGFPVHKDMEWVECDENIEVGTVYENGTFVAPTETEPSEEELITAMERKILREQAQERLATMTDKEKKDLVK